MGAIEVWEYGEERLRLADGYYVSATEFEAASQKLAFSHGQGLPGGVWSSNTPILRRDIGRTGSFLRCEQAAAVGVTGIDRDRKVVIGEKGEVAYDKLMLATGSAPFIIPLPGHDLPGVVGYRDLEDTDAMIDAASSQEASAVVIGGGLLGLEAAAGLRMRGMEATVLHIAGHLMERQLEETAGYLLQKDLEKRGIRVITKANTKAP